MVVVAGWPRSGTSLLMQVLDAGGMEAHVSRFARHPRAFNVNGIWEYAGLAHDPVGRLAAVADAPDACVKLIHRVLQVALEGGLRPAAVVMTDRPLEAVVASQEELFGEHAPGRDALVEIRARSRAMLVEFGVPFIEVNVPLLVDDPGSVVRPLAAFLQPRVGVRLDRAAMTAVPDPSQLHHR